MPRWKVPGLKLANCGVARQTGTHLDTELVPSGIDSGIGRTFAFALAFAREGADVLIAFYAP
jgi:hypothetical protein